MNQKRTRRTNEEKKIRTRRMSSRSLVKKVLLALLAAVILAGCTAGFGKGLVNAQEVENVSGQTDEPVKCYKSIEIRPGDSLWSIAEENRDAHDTSIQDYIDEIKQINGLHSDTIHSGQHLTIAYYK